MFINGTNRKRVEKIIEILDLIEKSAQSNKATDEDRQQLLQPILSRFADVPEPEPEPMPGYWTIDRIAEEAPLKDLGRAVFTLATRIDNHLYEMKK